MSRPLRGGVWLIDLGMVAKVRPCLFFSIPVEDTDRALMTLVPPTTSVRGSRFEVVIETRFLRTGAFDAQNLVTIPAAKGIRRLGNLTDEQMDAVAVAVS
jgi:mRNA interferase MazF